jgi:nitrate reductase NapE component
MTEHQKETLFLVAVLGTFGLILAVALVGFVVTYS